MSIVGTYQIDSAVARLLNTEGSRTHTALSEAVPSGGGSVLGSRLVTIGDSNTIAGENPGSFTYGGSYGFFAALFSSQRVQHIRNAGIGGNTSAMMLARFDTDVTPHKPTVVSIMAGTNDTFQVVPDATYRANIAALVDKVRKIGASPVLCTIMPVTSADAGHRLRIARANRWLSEYTAAEGIPLVDMYAAMADPANGNLLAQYDSGDGTHPNVVGQARMGQTWLTALDRLLPPPIALTTKSNVDPINLLSGGLFLGNSAGDGIADPWFSWGAPNSGTATRSVVNDAAVAGGKMQRLSNTNVDGSNAIAQNINSGYSIGDRLLVSCLVTKASGGPQVAILTQNYNQNVGQGYRVAYIDWQVAATRGVVAYEVVVGPGTEAVTVVLQANGGTGNVDFGEVTVVNLTANGLV